MKFRLFILISLLRIALFAQNTDIVEKYSQSKYCAGCHPEQVADWKSSLHAKSHVSHNVLYQKTLDFMSKALYQDTQKLSVECAKCHNPRISIQKVNKSFVLSKAFGAQNEDISKVSDALETSYLKEGINCIVCHNTDHIEHSSDLFKRGFDAVTWGKNHIMTGPFDSNRTTYHESVKREHFNTDVNLLCFVCHYGGENRNKLPIYTTGSEYEAALGDKKCVDCHMSVRTDGIIAPHVTKEGVDIQTRSVRRHLFAGVRNSDIAKDAIDVSSSQNGSKLLVTLINKTPHKVPTGYGSRALEITIAYKNGSQTLSTHTEKLDTVFIDQAGKKTIPYLATTLQSDLRLLPKEKRALQFDIPQGATSADIIVNYKLLGDDMQQLLDVKDQTYTKPYLLNNQSINFTKRVTP